jgi:hypothetical protein
MKWDVFISHASEDKAAIAEPLAKGLMQAGLKVWYDQFTLTVGDSLRRRIDEGLAQSRFGIVIISENFLAKEWPQIELDGLMAREVEGIKVILPVWHNIGRARVRACSPILAGRLAASTDAGLEKVIDDLMRAIKRDSKTIEANLEAPYELTKRILMMAPKLPEDFVQRPFEFAALKKQLLDNKGDAVAITAALRGAGGYGKTTLATALAQDPDIQHAYFDGILWATLGEKPESLLLIISDLITRLTGAQPGLNTINAVSSALGEALGDRRILLVIEDVWREQDLRPFMQGGTSTTRLVTTRNDSTLPTSAVRQSLDAMRDSEALELIGKGLPDPSTQHRELMALTGRLGEWPLLLKLVNGFLRDRVVKLRQALPAAIAAAKKRLDEKGFAAFDARNETERTKAVALTIGVSLEVLETSGRDRFSELGIFAEDAQVPIGIVEHLWRDHLDEIETENLLSEFYGLSLLLALDMDRRTLQLHDTICQFLRA